MKYYFAWCSQNEQYSPELHNREDEKIFSIDIQQKEAGLAVARLSMCKPVRGFAQSNEKQRAFIANDNGLLFCGRVINMPIHIDGELITLDFLAEPHPNSLCTESIESQNKLYYCDRINNSTSLSDFFKGENVITLGKNHFYDSLQIAVTGQPLSSVKVELTADWTQHLKGDMDIAPLIEREFPENMISTFTGDDLENRWWKSGKRVGTSPYKILDSSICKVKPPKTGVLGIYPTVSPILPKNVRFPRKWYKARLQVGWNLKQARREIASFELHQTVQDLFGSQRSKTLQIHLPNVVGKNYHWRPNHYYNRGFEIVHDGDVYKCKRRHLSEPQFSVQNWNWLRKGTHIDEQLVKGTFFNTQNGIQEISKAIDKAKAHLAASARIVRISVKAPLCVLEKVTTNHSLSLEDDRIPGGKAIGKVIKYRLLVDGEKSVAWAEATIACSIGSSDSYQDVEQFVPDSKIILKEINSTSNCGIIFSYHQPEQENFAPESPEDLIESVQVDNAPAEQLDKLLSHEGQAEYEKILSDAATSINIALRDLRSNEREESRFEVTIHGSWKPCMGIKIS